MASPQKPAPSETTLAWSRLGDAEEDHDAIRRACRRGVTHAALRSDRRRWETQGSAIASLARAIGDSCRASAFCDARPDVLLLTVRLCESFDDLMDEPAWTVVEAAARLAVLQDR